MADQRNNPFGIPGGGPIGIPGAAPQNSGPSLVKPVYVTPEPQRVPTGEAHVLAGWGARFGAHVLDILVRIAITLPIVVVLFVVFADHPFSSDIVDAPDGISNQGGIAITELILYGVTALLYAPVAMVRMDGATVGKRMVGIRVVMDNGLTPTFWQAFLREPILKGIVVNGIGGSFFVPALLSYLWPLWDAQSRAGHDFMARTRVVRAS